MMRPVLLKTATLLLLAVSPIDRADAQSAATTIAVAGGVATDQRGVRSSALTVAPNLTFATGNSLSLTLGGNATRYASQSFAFGGAASINALESIGRFAALGVTASANATALQGASRATFAMADVLPAFEVRLSPLVLYGGLRAASGIVTDAASPAPPSLPIGQPQSDRVSTTRSGVGPVYGGVLTLGTSTAALRLGVREERMRVGGVVAAERSGNASLSIALTPIAFFEIGAGAYDANRVLGTPAGNHVSAGLSFRLGGDHEPPPPKPSGVRPIPSGVTRLSIRAPNASRVEIAGDFNEWTPAPALRADNGVWYADLRIPPGQYRYAFRINGSEWRVPDGATTVDDGLGGKSAWLSVPSPEHAPRR
jgi:hypothetical protein